MAQQTQTYFTGEKQFQFDGCDINSDSGLSLLVVEKNHLKSVLNFILLMARKSNSYWRKDSSDVMDVVKCSRTNLRTKVWIKREFCEKINLQNFISI